MRSTIRHGLYLAGLTKENEEWLAAINAEAYEDWDWIKHNIDLLTIRHYVFDRLNRTVKATDEPLAEQLAKWGANV